MSLGGKRWTSRKICRKIFTVTNFLIVVVVVLKDTILPTVTLLKRF